MLHLLIYEDDKGVREALQQLLTAGGEFTVACMFENCDTVETDLKELRADVILMDIDMPGIGGIEGVRRAKAVRPVVSVVMFTVFEDDKKIFDAICAGADGYLLKSTPPEKISDALKDVYAGGAPMTPSIAKKVLGFFPRTTTQTDVPLTDKEREVLQELVNGKSYKQVAAALNITLETVRTHIKHIYSKLHVSSMSQAVAKAIRNKLL